MKIDPVPSVRYDDEIVCRSAYNAVRSSAVRKLFRIAETRGLKYFSNIELYDPLLMNMHIVSRTY
jgi:hypothetical protein